MKNYWKVNKEKSGYICSNCGMEIDYINRGRKCPFCNVEMSGFEDFYRGREITWEELRERRDKAVKQEMLEWTMEWIK